MEEAAARSAFAGTGYIVMFQVVRTPQYSLSLRTRCVKLPLPFLSHSAGTAINRERSTGMFRKTNKQAFSGGGGGGEQQSTTATETTTKN